MKAIAYCLIILTMLLTISSCGNEVENAVNIQLRYDDAPLVMFSDLTYPSGKTFQFQRISFFVSEMVLSKDNQTVHTEPVEYIDLSVSHSTAEGASEGFSFVLDTDGEELDYDKVDFNVGLTSEMNATVPEDYSSDNVLSRSSEYWRDWDSYIQIRLEGNLDINEDGEYGAGESFTLHLGTDEVMRNISQNITDATVDIIIDVNKIFDNNGMVYDLEAKPSLHALNDENIQIMNLLSSNLQSSISIE